MMSTDLARTKRKIFLRLSTPFQYKCIECQRSMKEKNHYVKFIQRCLQCPYSTRCSFAFDSHMLQHAALSGRSMQRSYELFRKQEVLNRDTIQCSCGFQTRFGNRYCEHYFDCLLSDRSIVEVLVPSKASGSKVLPLKVQESLELMRRFNKNRFKSSKALSSHLVQPNKLNKIEIAQETKNPLHDYTECCSNLNQYSLILAQKVSSMCSTFDASKLFRHNLNNNALFRALSLSNRRTGQLNDMSSSMLPEELPFSAEQWQKTLAQMARGDSALESSNLLEKKSVQCHEMRDYNFVNFDLVPCSQSIIM